MYPFLGHLKRPHLLFPRTSTRRSTARPCTSGEHSPGKTSIAWGEGSQGTELPQPAAALSLGTWDGDGGAAVGAGCRGLCPPCQLPAGDAAPWGNTGPTPIHPGCHALHMVPSLPGTCTS